MQIHVYATRTQPPVDSVNTNAIIREFIIMKKMILWEKNLKGGVGLLDFVSFF